MAMDRIVKQRVLESRYWKTKCYRMSLLSLIDECAELQTIGGLLANFEPTNFLTLVYKLTLINPSPEIIDTMLTQKYFKYLTAVVALFIRLQYDPLDVYKQLEPLLLDYRKLRLQSKSDVSILYMDEFIDDLLNKSQIFGVNMPTMPSRLVLEDAGLEVRKSPLESDSSDSDN